jgi:hypothetical protein
MKTVAPVKIQPPKLNLSVKPAGSLIRTFVTPGMMFTKA